MEEMHADVVIIGGGIAGLSSALGLAGRRIVVLTKVEFGRGGSTPIAQGGIACAMGRDDSPELHAADTLIAGDGLSISECVDILTKEGPDQIRKLVEIGAEFDRTSSGEFSFGREAAHSRRRILHAKGDSTGAEVVRALTHAVKNDPMIKIIDHCYVADLVVSEGRVIGATSIVGGKRLTVYAPAVVLASGGIGRIYLNTTNPVESVGDGLAIAARAGALLSDVEFVQFHPTALKTSLDPLPLLTEALRGDGATLVTSNGYRFMLDRHPDAELAPRDIVARGIWSAQHEFGEIYLDARCIGQDFDKKFPTVFALCQAAGLDPRHDRLPVTPAAHYHMGGVKVNDMGRSSALGLWTCGEVSATGVHGANRLASNSLLEGLVFGARVSQDIQLSCDFESKLPNVAPNDLSLSHTYLAPQEEERALRLRTTMWEDVGLVRSHDGLSRALAVFDEISQAQTQSLMLRNMLDAARIITTAAINRKESRGGHYRSDYPNHSPNIEHHPFVYTGNGPWC